jgi:alkanesulfonate monooxygenase SsuD/methylene tetrahydromethanopterin reductase-like flavin-dependent oxidoreductase (luciferase family)
VGKMAATLYALSSGRVILGLGAGGSAADAAAFGVSWPRARDRIAALGEAVEVMRILWRGGGSFGGRWYQLHDAPGYPGTGHPGTGRPGTGRPGGPPVLIGGHGPRLLRAAAHHADLCNVGFDLPADGWRDLAPLLGRYLGEAGRSRESLGLTHNATVLLGADEADVARQVSAWAARRGLTEEAARGRLGHSLTGTPGQVRERLQALADAGVGWVFVLFDDLPRLAGLRSFAEAVMPALHTGGNEGAEPP